MLGDPCPGTNKKAAAQAVCGTPGSTTAPTTAPTTVPTTPPTTAPSVTGLLIIREQKGEKKRNSLCLGRACGCEWSINPNRAQTLVLTLSFNFFLFLFFFFTTVCGGPAVEGGWVTLQCPSASQRIKAVNFASFGTPTGTCGNYVLGTCNAATSVSYAQSLCLNNNSCSV